MELAAVILNYNDAEKTISAVERIKDYSVIDAVTVVDNASDAADVERLKGRLNSLCSEKKIIFAETGRNGGYGFGNNFGVRLAFEKLGARYVLIANPDAVFSEECAQKLLLSLRDNKNALAASACMDDGSRGVQQTAWALRSWGGELLNSGPVCRRLFRRAINYSEDYFEGKTVCTVGAVHGSMLMVDAEKFISIGGYDENMFLYCEENVLGFKAREAGYSTLLLLDCGYAHEGSASIKKTLKGMTRRQLIRQRSERYYYRRYLKIGPIRLAATYLFQAAVLLETCIAEKLGKI